jgi:hypothetical protein
MTKVPSPEAGFSKLRLLIASTFGCVAVAFFAMISIAANPPSGTVTPTTPITYTAGPFLISNPSGTVPGAQPACTAQQPCDDFTLTVPSGPFNTTHNLVITTSWPNAAEDYDIYLRQGNATVKDAASASVPEVIVAEATAGTYVIRIVPFAVAGGTTTTTVQVVEKPATPPPTPPAVGTPRYHNFPAPGALGSRAGEPTLGAGKPSASQPGGPTLYIASLQTLRVTWDDCKSPAGSLWENKSFPTTSLTSLDPILFTDLGAGRLSPSRLFVSQLGPKTSFLAYSDNNGDSYLQSQGSGINSGVDHQTVGGGPYRSNSTPPPPPHPLYPNAIYYASQDLAVAQLGRSDDGGQTFGPAVPMYNLTQCGGLHGHVKVAPDGTVYIPNKNCGSKHAVVVSEDNGLTFAIRPIPDSVGGSLTDPSVGIDSDGKIYVAYQNSDGRAKVAVSADKGRTFMPSIDVGEVVGIRNNVFPAAAGGSSGRAAVQFLATTTPGNYQATGVFTGVWHIYASHTFDGGATWSTVRVTPENDPVQRGSICTSGTTCGADRNLLDFNDLEIDHEGRILIAYADGCVGCTSPTGADSRSAKATIARQSGGKRLLAQFDPPAEPAVPAAPNVTSVARASSGAVAVRWLEPDNGGSAVTGYNVYRKEGANGTFVRLGGNPTVTGTNRYDDTTAAPDVQYFYRVTAVNAIGEGMFCGEFAVGAPAGVPASRCVLPGLPIVTDPAGDETGDPANTQRDIREVTAAELFDPASTVNRVTFRMKVTTLSPAPLPSTRWAVFFTRQDPGATTSTEWFVTMVTDDTAAPGQPVYRYGHSTVGAGGTRSLVTDGTLDSGSFTPDGTILLTIGQPTRTNTGASGRTFPPLQPGETFTLVNGITQQSGGALLLTTDSTDNGTYAVAGNASCSPNRAPVAGLVANPQTGTAPLVVAFDASTSADPDSDPIVSYEFNYGDGTTETKSVPSASHTYRDSGAYNATVKVSDSRGMTSTNPADAVIQVGSTLQSVVSRKVHNGVALDLDLPLAGTPAVESRTGGGNGDHTIIFTFARDLTNVGSATASSTSGSPSVSSRSIGPAPNQYTVNLTGVPNTRRVTVRLDNVEDTEGANLTDVRAQMNVLLGDTNGDGVVNSGDALQTRNRAVSVGRHEQLPQRCERRRDHQRR